MAHVRGQFSTVVGANQVELDLFDVVVRKAEY